MSVRSANLLIGPAPSSHWNVACWAPPGWMEVAVHSPAYSTKRHVASANSETHARMIADEPYYRVKLTDAFNSPSIAVPELVSPPEVHRRSTPGRAAAKLECAGGPWHRDIEQPSLAEVFDIALGAAGSSQLLLVATFTDLASRGVCLHRPAAGERPAATWRDASVQLSDIVEHPVDIAAIVALPLKMNTFKVYCSAALIEMRGVCCD